MGKKVEQGFVAHLILSIERIGFKQGKETCLRIGLQGSAIV